MYEFLDGLVKGLLILIAVTIVGFIGLWVGVALIFLILTFPWLALAGFGMLLVAGIGMHLSE